MQYEPKKDLNCFRNERKPLLELFLELWKPLNMGHFHNKRKPMLGFIFEIAETIEIGLLSQ